MSNTTCTTTVQAAELSYPTIVVTPAENDTAGNLDDSAMPDVPEANVALGPPRDTSDPPLPESPADQLRRIERHGRRRPTTGIRTTILRKNLAHSMASTSSDVPVDPQTARLAEKVKQHELRRRRIRAQGVHTSAFNRRAGAAPSCSSSNWTCLTDQEWADKEAQVQITGKHLADAAEAFRWTPYLLDERDKFETSTLLANTRNRTAFIPDEEDEPWLPCGAPDRTGDLLFYEGYCADLVTREPAREFAARFASLLRRQKGRRRLWDEYWGRASVEHSAASTPITEGSPATPELEVTAEARSSLATSLSFTVPGMPIHFGFGTTAKVPSITTHDSLDDSMNIVFVEQPHAWSVVSTW